MSVARVVEGLARFLAAVVFVALCLSGAPVRAQTGVPTVTVTVFGPETLRSVTPPFVVNATGFGGVRPLRIRLQVGTDSRLGSVALDTTLLADSIVAIVPNRALPSDSRVFYSATVTDPNSGLTATSPITGPNVVPPWVTPVSPPTVVGQPVRTRSPRFVWRSPAVSEPPGPWSYTLIIITPLGSVENFVGPDTSFTPQDLESNAVYRWSVRATLPRSGQGEVVPSPFTFVVEDVMVSIATTELYRPFPSPFPGIVPQNPGTCVWFDLKNESVVELEVTDLRGLHVRRLVPNAEVVGRLAPGRYGRGRTEFNEGCDQRFLWDGTDDRGVYVPEGVYVIRFRGDGVQRFRRVVFRGPRR